MQHIATEWKVAGRATPRTTCVPADANPVAYLASTWFEHPDDIEVLSRIGIDLDALFSAVAGMADVLSEAGEVGPHFTCSEAEAVADVLRAGGQASAADYWIEGHATGDDEGDMHHPDYDPDAEG